MLEINSVIELLAKDWVKLYKVRPVITSLLTITLAAILVAGITYLEHVDRAKRVNKWLENLDYQNQIQQLDQIETSVEQLLSFVDSQKKTLQETEDTISNLKSEREKLQPLVETDRAVIEAVFKAQEDRANANVWRERWIGFGFGVAASLIASFICFVISMLLKNRHNKQMQPSTDVSAD